MRNNKFRAWDKKDKRMIVHDQDFIPLKVTNIGVFKLDATIKENRWILTDQDRFIIEQFTGLTDKDGKEIYEGDILIDPNLDEEITCEYDARIAGFIGWGDDRISGCYLLSEEGMEIIGNIHEATKWA